VASARLSGVLPDGVCLGADLSVVGSGQEVSTRTEVVADRAERSQEALGMLGGFEALRHPFPLPRRQVRVFSPIVQPLMPAMLCVRKYVSNGCRVACELVGDHHAAGRHSRHQAHGAGSARQQLDRAALGPGCPAQRRADRRLATASGAFRGSSTPFRPNATCLRRLLVVGVDRPRRWPRT